jgi:hypothetical protein
VQQTFDHVAKTLPGPVDNQNLNIVVNTHNKDKTKVFTALVDVQRVKAAIGSFISLGNPWYKDLKISDNNDLERTVVTIDDGMCHALCSPLQRRARRHWSTMGNECSASRHRVHPWTHSNRYSTTLFDLNMHQ